MTKTTVNKMNLIAQRNSVMISFKAPGEMKKLLERAAKKSNMTTSQYMKLALLDHLEKTQADNQ